MKNRDMKRHATTAMLVIFLAVVAVAARFYLIRGQSSNARESTVQRTKVLMDTVVDVRVDAEDAAKLVDEAFAIMKEMEQTLSRFVETSEIAEINRRAGEWVQVSSDTLDLIEQGIKIGRLTNGSFDITIGPVLDLWGFGTGKHQIPPQDELDQALALVDYSKVEVDREAMAVRIPAGAILDLGGIAKGFIVEQGIQHLRNANVERAIINAGGDIAVIGNRPDGQPWRVGVQDPKRPSELRWILPLTDQSVVTSGDYQRFFEADGQRWHHIIDPKTGYPARGLRSVTVVCPDVVTCDALATAIFVLGIEEGQKLVEEFEDVEVILVSDGRDWVSSQLEQVLITP